MAGRGGDVSGAIARPTHTRTTLRRPGAARTPRLRELPLPPPAPPSTELGSLITARPPAPPVTVTTERVIAGSLAERLWEDYLTSVGPLAKLAVLKHVDSREDVLGLLANPRIVKLVAWEGGRPVGLGMVTNDLESVVEISPTYLRSRFPDHAARDAIYVAMLVMVVPGMRGLAVFSRIYHELWNVPAKADGILVFDVCEFNRTTFDADERARRVAANFPNSSFDVLDRQTWYVAHLPEPLPTPPTRPQPPA